VTREAALARAHDLRDHLHALNVTTSIELITGRSGGWNGLKPVANLGHHVASRRSQGLTPFLHLVKVGRSDLSGPLANGYGGFDQVARIITMDWANHPGEGGPWTVPGVTIPANNGRPYIFGWEMEGGFTLDDWPTDHREFHARCFAATLKWMGRDERSHGEHGNPWAAGRKVDRIWYYQHLVEARAEIRQFLQEDDMPLTDADAGKVARELLDRIAHSDGELATHARERLAAAAWSHKSPTTNESMDFHLRQAARATQARDLAFQILAGVQEIAAEDVDEDAVGRATAAALLPDLAAVVAVAVGDAVDGLPDEDAEAIANRVVDEMSQRLTPAIT
jgi:hypothetical protein